MRIAFFMLLFTPVLAAAGDFVPGGNAGTLARQFALPPLGEPAVLPAGARALAATMDVANEYARVETADESIELDGETRRLRLSWRRGLGAGWDAGIEVPLLWTGGGFLDGWIEDWHRTFGLPNGGRETAPQDGYRHRYVREGLTQFDVRQPDSGPGDVSLTLGRRLGDSAALRALARLPTGEASTLLGGNAGGALWLDLALPLPGAARGYAAAGVSVNSAGELLSDRQERIVPFGGLGLLLPLTGRVRLSAQLQAHGALYRDSDLAPLSRVATPLTLGLQFALTPRLNLDLGFQEDPAVLASPDFGAYVALSLRP